jgi:hypothetical protein
MFGLCEHTWGHLRMASVFGLADIVTDPITVVQASEKTQPNPTRNGASNQYDNTRQRFKRAKS